MPLRLQSQLHQHHHHHHHHYNLTSPHMLMNLSPANHLQQQQQQQQQPPPPVPPPPLFGNGGGNSNGGRSLLPPVRLEFQQPYYVGDPYVSNSIVYADLALSANGAGPDTCRPPHYRRPPTEYAVLKFRDVGQEIDVWSGAYNLHLVYSHLANINPFSCDFLTEETEYNCVNNKFPTFFPFCLEVW